MPCWGTLQADGSFTDEAITFDVKEFKGVPGLDPAAMPWKDLGVEAFCESTGASEPFEGGLALDQAAAWLIPLSICAYPLVSNPFVS